MPWMARILQYLRQAIFRLAVSPHMLATRRRTLRNLLHRRDSHLPTERKTPEYNGEMEPCYNNCIDRHCRNSQN